MKINIIDAQLAVAGRLYVKYGDVYSAVETMPPGKHVSVACDSATAALKLARSLRQRYPALGYLIVRREETVRIGKATTPTP